MPRAPSTSCSASASTPRPRRRPRPGRSCSTTGCRSFWPGPGPGLDIPALPLLFYFFCDDIDAVAGVLEGAGVPVVRTGHPPHALGGEVKVLDPDGNTVLLGQRDRPASRPPAGDEGVIRVSI